MKIEINDLPTDGQYYAKIFDGPDGIDEADFLCSSLGECFEQIIIFRTLNSQKYYGGTEEKIVRQLKVENGGMMVAEIKK